MNTTRGCVVERIYALTWARDTMRTNRENLRTSGGLAAMCPLTPPSVEHRDGARRRSELRQPEPDSEERLIIQNYLDERR